MLDTLDERSTPGQLAAAANPSDDAVTDTMLGTDDHALKT
jgi:hypothetical protein